MADTLREFLVGLGWKINEGEQDRFTRALEAATLRAKLLGDMLEALARKAADMVASVATSFDQIYFAAHRMNTSVATIKDFGYAIEQLGGSASGARASLESMAEKLRANPGNIVWLNELGFGLNKTTKQLEVQNDLMQKAANMPLQNAKILAGLVGLDEQTLLAERHAAELQALMRESANFREQIGFNAETAASDANAFMTVWRRVSMEIGGLAEDLWTKLMKALTGPFQEFQRFIETNGPAIGKAIDTVTDAIGKMAAAWVASFEDMINKPDAYKNLRDGMQGFADQIKRAAEFLSSLVADLRWLNDFGNAGANVLNRLLGLPEVGRDSGAVAPPGVQKFEENVMKGDVPGTTNWFKKKYRQYAPTWMGGDKGEDTPTQTAPGVHGVAPGIPPEMNARAMALMDRLVSVHGWTPEAAAIAAGNAQQESGFKTDVMGDPSTPGGSWGLFQWNRERLDNLKAYAAGKKADWQDFNTQVDFFAKEASEMIPGWKSKSDLSGAGEISHAYEGYGDNSTGARVRNAQGYLSVYGRPGVAGAPGGGGPVVFGDSIAAGVKDALKAQGAAVQSMGSSWITSQIKRFSGDLRGRKIILSSGASNSHDPDAVAAQIDALKAKGVDPKDISVLGVGDRPDFAGFNDRLKSITEGAGAAFTPLGELAGDRVHSRDYGGLAAAALAAKPPRLAMPTLKAPPRMTGSMADFFGTPSLSGAMGGDVTNISAPHHTEIHVEGSGDPTAVAHMVGANQSHVAATMARHLQGATQ